jgi:hypothetical protein
VTVSTSVEKLVLVLLVVVLFTPVKFCNVELPVTRRFEAVRSELINALVNVPLVAKRLVLVASVLVTLPKNAPPILASVAKRLVDEAFVAKLLVVVALLPVAFTKVKFWSVEEPSNSKFVEVALVTVSLPSVKSLAVLSHVKLLSPPSTPPLLN